MNDERKASELETERTDYYIETLIDNSIEFDTDCKNDSNEFIRNFYYKEFPQDKDALKETKMIRRGFYEHNGWSYAKNDKSKDFRETYYTQNPKDLDIFLDEKFGYVKSNNNAKKHIADVLGYEKKISKPFSKIERMRDDLLTQDEADLLKMNGFTLNVLNGASNNLILALYFDFKYIELIKLKPALKSGFF